MCRRTALYRWTDEVATAFPHLSKPQAAVLALWSFGMVLARSCALTSVAPFLARLLGQPTNSLQQRLREFYLEAAAKTGRQRRAVGVTTCFAPLLGWVLRAWSGRQLPLAADATTLGSRFVVLTLSVVYRGTAIPVAWKVVPALAKQSWQEPWLALLRTFQGVVPPDYHVVLMADRGLWAKGL